MRVITTSAGAGVVFVVLVVRRDGLVTYPQPVDNIVDNYGSEVIHSTEKVHSRDENKYRKSIA